MLFRVGVFAMTGQTVSTIAFFPLASRRHLVRQSAVELDKLNGRAADDYWKKTCRTLGQELLSLGCPEDTMRTEVLEFQNAVQWELMWLNTGEDAAEG